MTKGRRKQTNYFASKSIVDDLGDCDFLIEQEQVGSDEDIAYIIANVQHIDPNPDFDFAEFKKKFKKKNKLSRRRIKKICQAIDKLDQQEMELQRQRKSLQISKHAGVFHYSEEPGYIESSPLTPDQKEYLSSSCVGATKLSGDSLLSSILNQDSKVSGEVSYEAPSDDVYTELEKINTLAKEKESSMQVKRLGNI